MTAAPYSVRQVDPAAPADAAVLTTLWRDNLHIGDGAERKLRWCYLDAPAGRGVAFVLQHQAPGGPPEPVGCIGLAPLGLFAGGQSLRAMQMVDLAVARRHRTLFPSRLLQRVAREHARDAADLTYGFPNQRAAQAVLSLGYDRLGEFRRYARPLRFAAHLRHLADTRMRSRPPAPLLAAAGAAIEAGDAGWLRLAGRLARRHGALVMDDVPGPAHDDLWQRMRERFAVMGDRSAGALTWRMRRGAGTPLRLCTLRAAGGVARAVALLDREGEAAHLRDLAATEPGHALALLDLLLPELRAEGAATVSLSFAGASWMPALLHARGFRPRPETRTVILDRGPRSRLPAALLHDPDAWFLTDYDEPG